MKKNELLNNLAKLSQVIGNEVAYAQGSGGNTSVKFDENQMAIKASGSNLKDVTPHSGHSVVNYKELIEFLGSKNLKKDNFSTLINKCSTTSNNKPSIETGFHSFLGKYVIHSHSAYANALTCAVGGQKIIQDLFPDAVCVSYKTPGIDLTLEIKKVLPSVIQPSGIIFLQNHGLIVWHSNYMQAILEHSRVSDTIRERMHLPRFNFDKNKSYIFDQDRSKILFPDQAVFSLGDDQMIQSESAQETICAYQFIIERIEMMKLHPSYLSVNEVTKLLSMESEQYRQSLIIK